MHARLPVNVQAVRPSSRRHAGTASGGSSSAAVEGKQVKNRLLQLPGKHTRQQRRVALALLLTLLLLLLLALQ
jgi:hypothetical protein